MEEHGLIARRFYSDHPPRAEYLLTDKGQELGMVVGALAVWGTPRPSRNRSGAYRLWRARPGRVLLSALRHPRREARGDPAS